MRKALPNNVGGESTRVAVYWDLTSITGLRNTFYLCLSVCISQSSRCDILYEPQSFFPYVYKAMHLYHVSVGSGSRITEYDGSIRVQEDNDLVEYAFQAPYKSILRCQTVCHRIPPLAA